MGMDVKEVVSYHVQPDKYVREKTTLRKTKVVMKLCSNFIPERIPFGECGCPPDDHYPIEKEIDDWKEVSREESEITLLEYLKSKVANWSDAFLLDIRASDDYYVVAKPLAPSKYGGYYSKKNWKEEIVSLTRNDFEKLRNGFNIAMGSGLVKGEVKQSGDYINVVVK